MHVHNFVIVSQYYHMNKLLIICGPTATGKTKIAIDLAKKFNGELIGADSRHVYKGLNILTGKDLPVDGTKIWATDLVEMRVPYSVSQYQQLARGIIDRIQIRGNLPILVGGTGLYIRAVTQHIDTVLVPPNISLRDTVYKQTLPELQKTLQFLDPPKWGSMNSSDRANPRRLARAIEVAKWYQSHPKNDNPRDASYDSCWIGLTGPLEVLKKNIEQRVRARFAHGVVDEVRSLGNTIDDATLPAATSLGLAIVQGVVAGQLQEAEAVIQWTSQEFAYAKRQLTWFRKEQRVHWFDITQKNYQTDIEALVREWYT
ncbi:MAG: tRNA (adenosine(37)-N6)-dimethylallyltransferase MiaA [Candidatus Gottesmanbacteria bacterium]|nr:tRNA (adenosine(37)-N6)-dimethylallyltransferase MiaA [Candidatus Gottesmanbacteria bacterium]